MRQLRVVLLAAVALYVVVLASGLGGFGVGGVSSSKAYEYGHTVILCFRGHTIEVDESALDRLLARGATIGPCT